MKPNMVLKPVADEKGMVLVVGLLLIAVLAILGTTAFLNSTTDMKISSNYKTNNEAFYIAEAGTERAREHLRSNVAGGSSVSALLSARVGNNGALSDSSDVTCFYTNGTWASDDVPYITNTSFGAGNYRVYLTNSSTDGVTSTTDTDEEVTLTSFGFGPSNSLAIISEVVKKLTLPPLPGAIVLPGPNVNFQGGNSNASSVAGGPESAVTLTSDVARESVVNQLTSISRLDNYTCNAGVGNCVNNESATIDPGWTSVSNLENIYNTLKSVADVAVTGNVTLTEAQVGTTSDRKIVVIDGNATLGPVNGAGILIVTGQLTLSGNFNYHGLILCIGQGNLLRNGGGNGDITGAIVVAKTRDTSNTKLTTLGNPTYNTAGGGNSDIVYDASQTSLPPASALFVKKSWKRL